MQNSEPSTHLGRFESWLKTHLTENVLFYFLLIVGLATGLIQLVLPAWHPELNNTIVISLCAGIQFFVSIFAGVAWSKRQAEKEANTRWVPLAASACEKLVTVMSSVRSLRHSVSQACKTASERMPELSDPRNRTLKTHFEGMCSSNATRMQDIEDHLQNGLSDWERFIAQNCDGHECADIGRKIESLRARLLPNEDRTANIGCDAKPNSTATPTSLNLTVSGTIMGKLNGDYKLNRITDDVWSCSNFFLRKLDSLWELQESRNPTNAFYLESGNDGGPIGQYRRCGVCPEDGFAVISGEYSKETAKGVNALNSDQQLLIAMRSDPVVRHLIGCHNATLKSVLRAIKDAVSIREFSGHFECRCWFVANENAVRSLNTWRDCLDMAPLQFDSKFLAECPLPKQPPTITIPLHNIDVQQLKPTARASESQDTQSKTQPLSPQGMI